MKKHLFVFECTGIHEAGLPEQLFNFSRSLQQAMQSAIPPATPAKFYACLTRAIA